MRQFSHKLHAPADAVMHFSFWSHFGPRHKIPFHFQHERLQSGADSGWHCHDDSYMLAVIRAGRGTSIINGAAYPVVRGDVFVVAPGLVHCVRDYQDIETDAFYFLPHLFSRTELSALRQMSGFWKLFAATRSPNRAGEPRMHLSPEKLREVEEASSRIERDLDSHTALDTMMARHQFFCLLGRMAQWHSTAKRTGKVTRDLQGDRVRNAYVATVADVVRFCEENLDTPLSVAQMAGKMFLSPDHFARLFSAEMGIPPAAYLRRMRLERARTLLKTTGLSIAEIARASGFSGANQLSHAFRATYGASPSDYRARFRRG